MLAPSPCEYTRTSPTRARTRGLPLQIFEYTTPVPVLPTCFIFPSFSSAERYRVAVASETCRSFSTSSLVILVLVVSACIILSRFFRFRSWVAIRALLRKSRIGCAGVGVLAAADGGSGIVSIGSGSGGNGSLGGI